MRGKLGLAVVVCLSRIASAHAANVSEFLTGTVAPGTTDKVGIFGPAGTDLSGLPLTVYFDYLPSYLSQGNNSNADTSVYYSNGSSPTYNAGLTNPNTAPSVLVIVTLNGQTVTYAPTSVGYVQVSNFEQNGSLIHSISVAATGIIHQPSIGLYVGYKNTVTFGQQLIGNPPASGFSNVLGVTSQPDTYSENINFSITKATR